ncbi:hypothetical protein SAMN05443245_7351 [Paraburkholderia fungorum]|uniref:Uncharacterized protein n=1 Tax=Paraburkholderia fungorum TaxID=134537 RepID=A0A1H1JWH9_9BURK|nr:hypothetical protein SAMN05443245_7351 [Paraburkholderia fungorum]
MFCASFVWRASADSRTLTTLSGYSRLELITFQGRCKSAFFSFRGNVFKLIAGMRSGIHLPGSGHLPMRLPDPQRPLAASDGGRLILHCSRPSGVHVGLVHPAGAAESIICLRQGHHEMLWQVSFSVSHPVFRHREKKGFGVAVALSGALRVLGAAFTAALLFASAWTDAPDPVRHHAVMRALACGATREET